MSKKTLRHRVIRLAHENAELRPHLLKALKASEVAPGAEDQIGAVEKGPLMHDPSDEWLQGQFTEGEGTELHDRQQSGELRDEARLRKAAIRLAHENPALRPHLLPLLKEAAVMDLSEGILDDEEMEELPRPLLSKWKGYLLSMTYETWTPEDVEIGDTDNRGWKFQDEDFDTLEDLLNYGDIQYESWLSWSSSHPDGKRDWIISDEDENFRTGERTIYNAFIERKDKKPLSKREIAYITKKLRLM